MTPEAVNTTYQAETDDVVNIGQKEEVVKDLELTGITSSVLGRHQLQMQNTGYHA